ncbi:MAG: arylesterase [Thiobacillus sp.]|jgi:acyl-CoA thioesterase-1|nr:arylesterase [Thiobacillus sp.]
MSMRIFLFWLYCLVAIPAAHAAGGTILVFGDSLSAAYGLPRQQGWVTLLEERLRQDKFTHRVVNASISGETSAGGLSRIGRALEQHRPALLILALGGNDGLRGLPVSQMQTNLDGIIRAAQRRRVKVLLLGVRMPPNYGPAYTREFTASFAALAGKHRTAFAPFLLEGFADRPEYFLDDGVHPNAAAQPLILETVWRQLRPLLGR